MLAALLGVVNAFDIPARQSFLVDMVGKEDLMNAIALNSTMFNGARVIGPAIAGILVARIGEGWCFLVNGLSYIAVIAGLLMMRVDRPTSLAPHGPALAHLIEGYRFARHTAPIRSLLLLLGLVSLVAMPYTVLMPVFADQILHGGARGLGILMGATGVGALLGAYAWRRAPAFWDWAAGSHSPAAASVSAWCCLPSRVISGCRSLCCCRWDSA